MLRILVEETTNRNGWAIRLILEGRVSGLWVEELENAWIRVREQQPYAITVDLRAVAFISKPGEELLRRLQRSGTELIRRNQLMRTAVAELGRMAPALAVAVALLLAASSYGEELRPEESPALGFGRYIASMQERNPFTEAGPTRVEIDAMLPGLAKRGRMIAIRETGASERSEYRAIEFTGDATVKRDVIARYLAAEEQGEALPYSSVAITPANYKFRYLGSVHSAGGTDYVFQITPRQKRIGLMHGEIWIDSETGVAVHQTGRFVKRPSVFVRRIEVVRNIEVRAGNGQTRVTHLTIETRMFGRAYLTVTERPLNPVEGSGRETEISEIAPDEAWASPRGFGSASR